MKETQVPVVLTVNGKMELVVQDVEGYRRMLERLEQIDALEAIQRGLKQMEHGEGQPAEEVFAEFRARHGMPNA